MSRRPTASRSLALILLVLLAGAVLGAPVAAHDHHHDDDGLHDPDCPLAALAALERQDGATVGPPPMSLGTATRLAARSTVESHVPDAAASARSRAPPTR